ADFRRLADHHAHAVIDEHAGADLRAGMDLDAGQPATEVRGEAAEPAQLVLPEPVRQAMDPDRMQSRIAGQHLPAGACRRVPVEDAGDVAAQPIEHERDYSPTKLLNYSFRSCKSALRRPRRMFTSSRSNAGTREKSRRQRSRKREFGAMKPLLVAASSRCE